MLIHNIVCVLLFQLINRRMDCKEYCHNEEFIADCYNNHNNNQYNSNNNNNNGHDNHQSDRVVLMTSALYGRMSTGSCVKTDFGFVGCYENVINHAHARCSGQRACIIRVPDATLDRTRPCNEDLKNYLDASYICINVATPRAEGHSCDLASEGVKFEGYISNQVEEILQASESKMKIHHSKPIPLRASPLTYSSPPCGDPRRPWIIKVMGGQRINITLMDFYFEPGIDEEEPPIDSIPTDHLSPQPSTTTTTTTTTTTIYPLNHCDKYATFEDKAVFAAVESPNGNISIGGRNETYSEDEEYSQPGEMDQAPGVLHRETRDAPMREGIGGGRVLCGKKNVKTSHAFLSRTNEVAVAIYRWSTDQEYKFLLRYEAIGCPDQLMHAPSNVWTRRESKSEMVVGCRGLPSLSWRLVCHGNVWVGNEANCSSAGAKDARREDGLPSLSIGASILIILGVSLAIGLTVLLFGLYYMKRRRELELSRLPESTLLRSMKHPPHESGRESSSCCPSFDVRDSTLLAPVLTTRAPSYETSKSTAMTSSLGRPMARRATAYEYVWELLPDRGGRFSSPQLGEHQPAEHQARPDLVRLHGQRRSDPPTPLNCLILDEDVDLAKLGKQRIHKNKMAEERDAKDLKKRGSDFIEAPRCTCFIQQQQINQSYGRVVPRPPNPNTSSGPTTPGADSLYSQVGDRKRTPPGTVGTPCSYTYPYHYYKPPSNGSTYSRPSSGMMSGQQISMPKMASSSGNTSEVVSPSCLAGQSYVQQTPLLPFPVDPAQERMCRSCGHVIDRRADPLDSVAATGLHDEKLQPFCCVTSSAKTNMATGTTAAGQTNSPPSLNSPSPS